MQKDLREVLSLIDKKYGDEIFDDKFELTCVLDDVAPWLQSEIEAINMLPMKNIRLALAANTNLNQEILQMNILNEIEEQYAENKKITEQCVCLLSGMVNKHTFSQELNKTNDSAKDEGKGKKLSEEEIKKEIDKIVREQIQKQQKR